MRFTLEKQLYSNGLMVVHTVKLIYNQHLYNEVDLDQLRSQIGFVTQDTQLFAGTIKENLLFVHCFKA